MSDRLPLRVGPVPEKEVGKKKSRKEEKGKGKGKKGKGKGKGKDKGKGKGKGHHNTGEYYEWWTPEGYWWPEYDDWSDWSYEGKGYSEDGGEEGEGEPEAEGGDFCTLSINNINSSEVSNDEGYQYVRMVMDSGASISALPKAVGRGFPITQDDHSGFEYLGAG